MKLNELKGAKQVTKTGEKMMYHGTSLTAWKKIQAEGELRPQKTSVSFFRGNTSTIVGVTDKQVYLAGSEHKSEYYADLQANHTNSKPVVLEIPMKHLDPDLFYPDDDLLIVAVGNRLKIDEDGVAKLLKNPTPEVIEVVEEEIEKWRAYAKKHNYNTYDFKDNVGYRGSIPLKYITPITVEPIPRNYDLG